LRGIYSKVRIRLEMRCERKTIRLRNQKRKGKGKGEMMGKCFIVPCGGEPPLAHRRCQMTKGCAPKQEAHDFSHGRFTVFKKKDFVILFVGNNDWVKGLSYLVDAIANLNNVKLVIVGLIEDKQIKEKLGDRVCFVGQIEHEKLAEYYSMATMLCVPSVYEAFGLIYGEAMCYGLPCIGSKGTGAEETIVDGYNGFLVEKRDIKGLEIAILKLCNPKIRVKFSQNARITAFKSNGGWNASAGKMIDIYEKLLVNQ